MDKKDLVLVHVNMDGVAVEYLWSDEMVKEKWVYYYNQIKNKLRLGKYKRTIRPTKRHKFKMEVHPKCPVTPLQYTAYLRPFLEKGRSQGILKTIDEIQLPREVSLFAKEAFGKYLIKNLKVQKRW